MKYTPGISSVRNSINRSQPSSVRFGLTKTGFVLFPVLVFLLPFQVFSKSIQVCDVCEYKSLKTAISAASAFDSILVKKGHYQEFNLVIDKPLTLLGENFPIIDANGKGSIFLITDTRSVEISGFALVNVKPSFLEDLAAVKVMNSPQCIINNNQIINTCYGIYLSHSDSCLIEKNNLKAYGKRESSSGNGIHLWYSNNATIQYNQVSGHRDGIYFEFVENSLIQKNYCHDQIRYGLHFMFSHGCSYVENYFQNNGAGVAVMYSKKINMIKNQFADNWSQISHGVLLKDISDSKITQNIFRRNTIAIYAEGCNRNEIMQNEFRENGWGMKILGNCEENNILQNNFFSNTFEVVTNSSRNKNMFNENYWSNYNGYDLNHDGYGDVPHSPITLYSYMIEEVPSSIILLRSLFIDLLNMAEKMTPVITPESYKDEKPKMNPHEW